MTVIPLEGFTPSPRYAPLTTPWTRARIEEAASDTGPWSVIEPAFDLDPVPDLIDPDACNFTTTHAVLDDGWYRVVWIDADGHEEASVPVYNDPAPLRPSIAALGALMRARTKARGGNELGTFTADTRPTADQVRECIDRVLPLAMLDLGEVRDDQAKAARTAVTYRVAQELELGYWPEQNDTDESVAGQYGRLYEAAVKAVTMAVKDNQAGASHVGFGSLRVLGRDGIADG